MKSTIDRKSPWTRRESHLSLHRARLKKTVARRDASPVKQRLVIDFDKSDGILGGSAAHGHDGADRIAAEGHFVDRRPVVHRFATGNGVGRAAKEFDLAEQLLSGQLLTTPDSSRCPVPSATITLALNITSTLGRGTIVRTGAAVADRQVRELSCCLGMQRRSRQRKRAHQAAERRPGLARALNPP